MGKVLKCGIGDWFMSQVRILGIGDWYMSQVRILIVKSQGWYFGRGREDVCAITNDIQKWREWISVIEKEYFFVCFVLYILDYCLSGL